MDTYGMPIVFDEPLYDFYTNSDLADFVEYGVDSNLVNEDLNS
jgi:hypothetical protein